MISLAGSVQNFLKGQNLRAGFEAKKQSAREELSPVAAAVAQMNKQMRESKQSGIVTRMVIGDKLSSDELAYLRKNRPDLYIRAVRMKQEREAYEKELKRCKTKEEVRRSNLLKTTSLAQAFREAQRSGDSGLASEISMRANGFEKEHVAFMRTDTYQRLPQNEDELKKRKKKNKLIANEAVSVQLSENALRRNAQRLKCNIQKVTNDRPNKVKRAQSRYCDKRV